ncbi:hypothetical protein C5167_049360 [Papaver somniferum]|uniref:Plastid lipid-associated protein/fibrillin conserved domain-containing protein n=1 Tax=Papaver somniferum TaxID=3469 RepID=A0A4Y7KPL3_PAPSO|nr:probable plastid-lipid-associated protein 10, chloroplastic isoform X2 [Papaver somniferum]RZC73879.1 hypothetical protein C5167_049360 [Papaver somniferum]
MELSPFPSSTSYFTRNTNLHDPNNINQSQFTSTRRRREISPISIPRVNVKSPSSRSSVICLSTATTTTTKIDEFELESKKHDLLRAIQDTQRGLITNPNQRSSIEEALVCVEGYDAGTEIDLKKLDGTWRLQYTSASDVVVLFESAQRFPFLQVGQIFQKFECRNQTDGGVVRNVVQWSIPSLLEEQEGATLLVSANFSVVSKRNIYLEFEEISVQNIKISEELQAWIAPAVLPRSYLSLQILQFLQTFKAAVPVSSPGRRSAGGLYYLSYLDNNMLLGRAVGGGGVFVFTKAQPFLL